jgi:LmbE family N-acetylglucosaminyl deacetylase
MSRRTLLGVWAHPDDEAYTSAGLMAEFRRRGDRVVVVTATLGERGTTDPEAWPPHRLAPLRHAELRNSLAVLDVDELHVLGYADGTCAASDGTDVVARWISDLAPDLIVTFGPDGMTGHPDHRAVSSWTTAAWTASASGADLWYATLTPEFHRKWDATNQRVGLWADQPAPPCTDPADLARTTTLADDILDLKLEALHAHASQTRELVELVGAETYREWWRTESFRRADPTTAITRPVAGRRRAFL